MQAFFGQRVGGQDDQHHAEQCAEHGPLNRNPERIQEVAVAERFGIGIDREVDGPERDQVGGCRRFAAEGHRQNMDERQHAQEREHRDEEQVESVEDTVAGRFVVHLDSSLENAVIGDFVSHPVGRNDQEHRHEGFK